jgi:hypothetical protein
LSIAVDPITGAALVAGSTLSRDFPTTPGAYDTTSDAGFPFSDAFVVKLATACLTGSWSNYGAGWPGTNGVPAFTAGGAPALCTKLVLNLANSAGSSTAALLLMGSTIDDEATPYGGHRLVVPATLVSLVLPGSGLILSADVPCDDSLCGVRIWLQALESDPGASHGVSFTPGLMLALGS